ncbi:SAM-dependent methyltransferase [Streptosporangium sp. NPDC048865]|uniref:SAM-dependent methyltransferase n=1 Tax=Streptosporangium sp. NPDC048865 TaxID=3155766 RepID=UPI00344A562A
MASPHPERVRFDPTIPNAGRITDYFLGGKDNFATDRAAAQAALSIAPELPAMSREGRRFLGRAVRFLVETGIRQFVDIGCGLPTQGSVHQILRGIAPEARVVYVDNDPMVVVHAQALLKENTPATVVEADIRDPERLLAHPGLTDMIDLDEPVAILLFSVLTDLSDDVEVMQVLAALQKAVAPGSYLALSHAVSDLCPERTARLAALFQDSGSITGPRRANLRTKAEVELFFDGLRPVDPGVVYIPEWRPEGAVPHRPDSVWVVGGVALKE